jgi:formylglycine-generating enzyme required for sulfatase activity
VTGCVFALFAAAALSALGVPPSESTEVTQIPAGEFHSVLPENEGEPVPVESFYLDIYPVTNREFLEFVEENPKWRRSNIPGMFAQSSYLDQWTSDLELGEAPAAGPKHPVTRVSWFAASEYCKEQGGRLPTRAEWEYAAMQLEFDSPEKWKKLGRELISWYSVVDTQDPEPTGSTEYTTKQGVRDMHGLVIEWVEDFKPPVADSLSMDCGTLGRLQGGGAAYSQARAIRTITRMSMEPQTTTSTIGFRCAYDEKPQPEDRR